MTNPAVTKAVDPKALSRFDLVIDVRSPAEFAEDHVPGAVNMPVLDDAERAEIGTIYVRESRFKARRVGAAKVARNVAGHIETHLFERDGSFAPLVYCWRGGQRSESMATILANVGWRTTLLEGGYKTYRRWVQGRLYDEALPHKLVLLDGGTGCAKTEMLGRLKARGVQVVDLEGLAEHRGSLFGGMGGGGQPSQKMFESRLLAAFDALDPSRPVVVEAESAKIGDRITPPALWTAMAEAPRIILSAPLEARARYLVAVYSEIIADRAALDEAIAQLPVKASAKRRADWVEIADRGDYAELAAAIIKLHYDPSYARSSKGNGRAVLGRIEMEALDEAVQEAAANEVVRLVDAISGQGLERTT